MSFIGEEIFDEIDRVIIVSAKQCEELFHESLRCNLNIGKSSAVNLAIATRIARRFKSIVGTTTFDDVSRYEEIGNRELAEFSFEADSISKFLNSEIVKKLHVVLEALQSDAVYQI